MNAWEFDDVGWASRPVFHAVASLRTSSVSPRRTAATHAAHDLPVRGTEKEILHRAVTAAASGTGSFVVIEGHGGFGKTQLLRFTESVARDHGLRTIHPSPEAFERVQADGVPAAVLVDDADRLDDRTLRALDRVADATWTGPVLLVMCVRPSTWKEHPELVRIVPSCGARVVQLAPLDRFELQTVVTHVGGRTDAARIDDLALLRIGDPELATTVAVWLGREEASASELVERGVQPPSEIRQMVGRRIAMLGPVVVGVAEALAVLGADADRGRVARVTGHAPEDVFVALRELAGANMLTDDVGRPSFVHDLFRLAVYFDIDTIERSRIHGLAAAVLHEDGATSRSVARHLLPSETLGADWCVDALGRAAFRARTDGDPHAALGYLTRALQEPAPDERRLDLLVRIGHLEAGLGRQWAARTIRDALDYAATALHRSRVLGELGRVLADQGRHWEAAEAFASAQSMLEDAEATNHASCADLQARRRAMRWLDPRIPQDAADDGRPPGSGPVAMVLDAFDAVIGGASAPDAARRTDDAITAFRGGTPGQIDTITGCFAAATLTFADDLERSDAVLHVIEHGQAWTCCTAGPGLVRHRQAVNALRRGHLEAALLAGTESLEILESSGWQRHAVAVRATLAQIRMEKGQDDAAVDVLASLPSAGSTAIPALLDHLYVAATGSLVQRDLERAVELFDQLGETARGYGIDNPVLAPWRSGKAAALLLGGHGDEAAVLATAELELAERIAAPRVVARAKRVLGQAVGGAQGLELLAGAERLLDGRQLRLDLAWTRLAHGRLLRAANQRSRARDCLRRAQAAAREMGAVRLERHADDELRVLGVGDTTNAPDAVESLTPAERRVVDLALEGLSNRAIAGRLCVSVKAVEFHLSNVYAKLGISSRRELGGVLPAIVPANA